MQRKAKRSARKKKAKSGESAADAAFIFIDDLFKAIRSGAGPQLIAIPTEMTRKMLMLCHPDKHGNSPVATEVTRWLLDQRDKNAGWIITATKGNGGAHDSD